MSAGRGIAVLTGGVGYIGRHLATHLAGQGWEPVLLVRRNGVVPNRQSFTHFRFVEYDGTQASLASLSLEERAQVVFFHLAANANVGSELGDIEGLIDSNIRFGAHLLGYMAARGFRNIVVAETYWQFDRAGTLGGNTLYAASKSAFSLLLQQFSRHGINSTALVLYDVYGPRDGRGKLVNALIESAVNQTPVELTPGEQSLDYVYVDDVVRAFETAGAALLAASAREGSFCRHTVRSLEVRRLKDFVEILGQAVGRPPNAKWGAKPYPAHQILLPWLPPETEQLPGWRPEHTFYSGVRKILEHGQADSHDLHSQL